MKKFLFTFTTLVSLNCWAAQPEAIIKESFYIGSLNDFSSNIVQAYTKNGVAERDARATVDFLKTEMDLLAVKKKVMDCFEEKKLYQQDLTKEQFPVVEKCLAPLTKSFQEQNAAYQKKGIPTAGVYAVYLMVENEDVVKNLLTENNVPDIYALLATQIGYSRLDLKKWRNEIQNCIVKNKPNTQEVTKEEFETFYKCSYGFGEALIKEASGAVTEFIDAESTGAKK